MAQGDEADRGRFGTHARRGHASDVSAHRVDATPRRENPKRVHAPIAAHFFRTSYEKAAHIACRWLRDATALPPDRQRSAPMVWSKKPRLSNPPNTMLPPPVCKQCGAPMDWKRTRRAFGNRGVVTMTVFACETCEEITQVEGP